MFARRALCNRARFPCACSLRTVMKQTAAVVADDSCKGRQAPLTILKDFPVKEPQEGEVLVKVYLRPINPADLKMLTLTYPGRLPENLTFPAVLGAEGVGRVVRNGPRASKFSEGMRVVAAPWPAGTPSGANASNFLEGMRIMAAPWAAGTPSGGTWQQYVPVLEASLIAVPEAVPDEAAAQFLINPTTAYGFLEVLQVPAGKWLLQAAAGSTLGRLLIALAKARGVRTINLVRRRAQVQELLDIGADAVICTEDEDIVARVREITGEELAYGAVDPVAGTMTGTLAAATRTGGYVLVYGSLGGTDVTVALKDLQYRSVTIKGFWLFPWLRTLGDQRAEVLAKLMRLMAEGVVAPHSGKKFPLEQANEAVAAAQKPGRSSEGKFFLEG